MSKGPKHQTNERAARHVRSIVEDATFMHEHGETPEAIAQRLKLAPATVARYFAFVGKCPPWADQ